MKRIFRFGKINITKLVQWILRIADELDDNKQYECKITRYYPARSTDANAYAWVLIRELAQVIGRDPEEVYRDHIDRCGGNYVIVPIRNDAVEHMRHVWTGKGLGWKVNTIGESKLSGFTNLALFYGSSAFNTKEMYNFLENIIFECKQHNIDTDTPEQIARRAKEWGE